ncbi:MAG: lipid kinase [Bradyrhizobium sp.]|uniref:lipid kinase n=1 Tax=Bradyrhizobium sp. TaxID=376 RepID=UPI0027302307|nr:lipid kinase [Bradyrhizobium sp.]MDP1867148.1 lipid kinase [Bradyrhizobium sp.]
MTKRALLIINGNSRSGRDSHTEVIEGLRRLGIDPIHKECDSREELSPLIVREGAHADMVIIGGGDGTLNAAAAGLAEIKLPLGILPLGTANDLARTLGIPPDLKSALDIIGGGRVRSIDVGIVNGVMFFNVASVGLSAELAEKLTAETKRRFGKLGYALTALRVLAGARPFRADIISEGRRNRSLTLQIAVGNGRYYGGGNVVEKNAEIDDESLRLYSLEFVNTWRMILMLRSFRTGEHGALDEVRTLRAGRFEIRTRRPRPVNADGEIVTQTPAVFSVSPKAIEVIVPGES